MVSLLEDGVKPREIFSKMLLQYEESYMNRANVHKWVDPFKCG